MPEKVSARIANPDSTFLRNGRNRWSVRRISHSSSNCKRYSRKNARPTRHNIPDAPVTPWIAVILCLIGLRSEFGFSEMESTQSVLVSPMISTRHVCKREDIRSTVIEPECGSSLFVSYTPKSNVVTAGIISAFGMVFFHFHQNAIKQFQ